MVLKAGIWGADMPTAAHFLLRYAYEQTMVSAVWGMQDPVTIATAMGLEPAAVLRPSIATGVAPSEPECARGLLQVTGLCAVRSLIATTLFLSQVPCSPPRARPRQAPGTLASKTGASLRLARHGWR